MPKPERYHEVFVSSTFVDLHEERQAVFQTLLRMNCLPVCMEVFTNGSPDLWTMIEGLIRRCDLFVLIVAGRSGAEADDGTPYTQKEFLYAQAQGIPILIYPHSAPDTHRPEQSADESATQREKLKNFHALLRKGSIRPWASVSELRASVAEDLASTLPKCRASWSRTQQGLVEIFADEINALRDRLDGTEVQTLTRLLRTTLQQFQFVHSRDRLMRIGDILPWLSEGEWSTLTDFARAQALVRTDGAGTLSEPMKRSVVDMVAHYQSQLTNFEAGAVEVEGELINVVAGHFMNAVTQSFRALSNEDFEYWAHKDSRIYRENNLALIEKGKTVERVFVMPRATFGSPTVHDVIAEQLATKIRVRVIASEDVDSLLPSKIERDFGLHDAFAVSFFRNYYGRSFRVETARETVARFTRRYDLVAQHSEVVPNKLAGDKRLFEEPAQFEEWHKQQDARRQR